MGQYEEAKRFNCTPRVPLKSMQLTYTAYHSLALLLEKEPGNLQAQSLADLIDQKVTRGASSSPTPNVNVFY